MRSFRSVRALGLALVAGAVLAGCGSEVALEKQPAASALSQPNYAGLSVYTLVDDGFSIGVPSGWTAMTSEDAESENVTAIVKASPRLATFRNMFLKRNSHFKLIALEYDPEACICSTISVIVLPAEAGRKARDFEADGLATAREIALTGTRPKLTRMKTPAGSGFRVTTRTKMTGTNVPVIMTQYFILTKKTAYVLTYTASLDVTKTYGRLFVRSARSLREV